MKGHKIIEQTRKYLDYLEDHLNNVNKAFNFVKERCQDLFDDWDGLEKDILEHDLSKFSNEEFIAYRKHFYPVEFETPPDELELQSWLHHLDCNYNHHVEAARYEFTKKNLLHTVIDWTAMGYHFKDTAEAFYNKNKVRFCLPELADYYLQTIFARLK